MPFALVNACREDFLCNLQALLVPPLLPLDAVRKTLSVSTISQSRSIISVAENFAEDKLRLLVLMLLALEELDSILFELLKEPTEPEFLLAFFSSFRIFSWSIIFQEMPSIKLLTPKLISTFDTCSHFIPQA